MTAKPNTGAERRQLVREISREISRLREGAKCSKAAGGCDRIAIELAELERQLSEKQNPHGGKHERND